MVKRIIPGIGQGCCVEQSIYFNCRERHRVLYDCGSVNRKALRDYIDTIDANVPTTLVVSHLHFDHINGIPYLIDHFKKKNRKIDRLFLPNCNHGLLILFAMSIAVNSTDESADEREDENYQLLNIIHSLQNPENNQYFNEVMFISPHGSEGENYFMGTTKKDDNAQDIVKLVDNLYWKIKFWVDPGIYSLLKKNELELLENVKLEDFYQKKDIKEIKTVYDKIVLRNRKDFNQTSMLMASYFNNFSLQKRLLPLYIYCLPAFFYDGFICTGDYPFADPIMGKEIYKHYFLEQFCIQQMMLPHHGGAGYCDYIPFDYIKKAYAQNGKNNKYKHPDGKIINLLENMGIEFVNKQD